MHSLWLVLFGMVVGCFAAFTGLGGGMLMLPLLFTLGYTAQEAVGVNFVAMLIIVLSSVIAHSNISNINYTTGLLLGAGGIAGSQLGARLLPLVSTAQFKKIFACVLIALALRMLFQKS